MIKAFLIAFGACLLLGAGVNGQITIDSPENITYNTTNVDLNVSSNLTTVVMWFYNLNDNQTDNITFTPNITLENLTLGLTNKLTVFVNGSNETGSLYGLGLYSSGLYGFIDTAPKIFSATVFFSINQVLRWHIINITGAVVILTMILLLAGLMLRPSI